MHEKYWLSIISGWYKKTRRSTGILRQPNTIENDPNLYYNIGSIYDELRKPTSDRKISAFGLRVKKG